MLDRSNGKGRLQIQEKDLVLNGTPGNVIDNVA